MPSTRSLEASKPHAAGGVLRVLAVNLGVLLVLAAIAELIFGGWLWGPRYGSLTVPRDVVRSFDTANLYDGGKRVRYSRDEHGLRGAYGDPGAIDILTIGGSTTNQLYIDDTETWQARLQDRFRAAGRPIIVVNAGVEGQSTRGHLVAFARWLAKIPGLKPRYVLAYVGINDEALHDAERFDVLEPQKFPRRVRHWIANQSAFYRLYRTVKGMLAAYDTHLVHGQSIYTGLAWMPYLPAAARIETQPSREAELDAYKERLTHLAETIRAFGARPIFVSQPTAEFRIKDGWVWVPTAGGGPRAGEYRTIAQFNQATLEVCEDVRAICLDLAREVEFTEGDFYDRVHNTPEGARKIADYLFEKLREVGGF